MSSEEIKAHERAIQQGKRYQRTGRLEAFKLDPEVFDALEGLGFL